MQTNDTFQPQTFEPSGYISPTALIEGGTTTKSTFNSARPTTPSGGFFTPWQQNPVIVEPKMESDGKEAKTA